MKRYGLCAIVLLFFIVPAFSQVNKDSALRKQIVQIAKPIK